MVGGWGHPWGGIVLGACACLALGRFSEPLMSGSRGGTYIDKRWLVRWQRDVQILGVSCDSN